MIDTGIEHLDPGIEDKASILLPSKCKRCGAALDYITRGHTPLWWYVDDPHLLSALERYPEGTLVAPPPGAIPASDKRFKRCSG